MVGIPSDEGFNLHQFLKSFARIFHIKKNKYHSFDWFCYLSSFLYVLKKVKLVKVSSLNCPSKQQGSSSTQCFIQVHPNQVGIFRQVLDVLLALIHFFFRSSCSIMYVKYRFKFESISHTRVKLLFKIAAVSLVWLKRQLRLKISVKLSDVFTSYVI